MRRCIFCDRPKVTKEHILPQWLNSVLPSDGTHFASIMVRERNAYRTHLTRALDHVIKMVCKQCNNGWMSELEGAAQPVLTPMIQGRRATLSLVEQRIVARWAAKTITLACLALTPPVAVDGRQLRWLAERPEAPPNVRVWVAAYRGRSWGCRQDHYRLGVALTGNPASDPTVDIFTLCVGHLVMQSAIRPFDLDDMRIEAAPHLASLAQQVWPPTMFACVWPPPGSLDDVQYNQYARPHSHPVFVSQANPGSKPPDPRLGQRITLRGAGPLLD